MKKLIYMLMASLLLGTAAVAPIGCAQNMAKKSNIEVRFTGRVEHIEADTCMDGAAYRLVSVESGSEKRTRLKPSNDSIKAELEKVVGKRFQVTVAGWPKGSIENCEYVEVNSVTPGPQ